MKFISLERPMYVIASVSEAISILFIKFRLLRRSFLTPRNDLDLEVFG